MCIQGGHATRTCAGDGLAVNVILHIARCKDPLDTGHRGKTLEPALGDDVAVLHLKLVGEDLGVGLMSNGNEAALYAQIFRALWVGQGGLESDASDP